MKLEDHIPVIDIESHQPTQLNRSEVLMRAIVYMKEGQLPKIDFIYINSDQELLDSLYNKARAAIHYVLTLQYRAKLSPSYKKTLDYLNDTRLVVERTLDPSFTGAAFEVEEEPIILLENPKSSEKV